MKFILAAFTSLGFVANALSQTSILLEGPKEAQSYEWNQVAGPELVNIYAADKRTAHVQLPKKPGQYEFEVLAITDSKDVMTSKKVVKVD